MADQNYLVMVGLGKDDCGDTLEYQSQSPQQVRIHPFIQILCPEVEMVFVGLFAPNLGRSKVSIVLRVRTWALG